MSDDRLTHLEERVVHLSAALDDLSDVATAQGHEIALLTNRVRMLMQREAERDLSEGGTVPLADQKPPHW